MDRPRSSDWCRTARNTIMLKPDRQAQPIICFQKFGILKTIQWYCTTEYVFFQGFIKIYVRRAGNRTVCRASARILFQRYSIRKSTTVFCPSPRKRPFPLPALWAKPRASSRVFPPARPFTRPWNWQRKRKTGARPLLCCCRTPETAIYLQSYLKHKKRRWLGGCA